MKKQVALIFPYFGKKPEWFDYFLLSASRNYSVDWFIFTDCPYDIKLFENIHFIRMTISDFNELATNKLGYEIKIKHPYKLCEFKPAYGKIFSEFIQEYFYWGYGDIDLVYGDIVKHLPSDWYGKYDILSNHSEFIPGHLCILKNTKKIVELFRQSPIHKDIFQSNLYYGFDETINPIKVNPNPFFLNLSKAIKINNHLLNFYLSNRLNNSILRRFIIPFKKNVKGDKRLITKYDFTSIVKYNYEISGNITVKFNTTYNCDMMLYKQGIKKWLIEWSDGNLRNLTTGQDIMYFHFMMSKNKRKFKINKADLSGNKFLISREGIRQV